MAHRIGVSVMDEIYTAIEVIARNEGRSVTEVARLLLRGGLRSYERGRPLTCGYPKCTRRGCCGNRKNAPPGVVVPFRILGPALFLTVAIFTMTCCASIRQTQDYEQRSQGVRMAASPESVKACQLIGSIAPADYRRFGGPSSEADIPHWLRVQTARNGGNAVLMSGSGMTTVGEMYRCP